RSLHHVLHAQVSNPNFAHDIDFAPKQVFRGDEREYKDFMLGEWAWNEADVLSKEPENIDVTFCLIILRSNKTTVSVVTIQNEYCLLYLSNGLVCNSACRAQKNVVSLVAFLSVPKGTFCHSRYHCMTVAEIVCCADSNFCHLIYGLGPYIADYPEQVLLACVIQGWCTKCTSHCTALNNGDLPWQCHAHTQALLQALNLKVIWDEYGIVGDLVVSLCLLQCLVPCILILILIYKPFTTGFPHAKIHNMLSPDLLHQIITRTFKDHLVT
ncbi:hypothetical protein BC628DRAFT_1313730, partial [Trametes gibbosa]